MDVFFSQRLLKIVSKNMVSTIFFGYPKVIDSKCLDFRYCMSRSLGDFFWLFEYRTFPAKGVAVKKVRRFTWTSPLK